ncbi:uncharacterized protein [Triticum aestivum]|uniref:uncharacterized protein n=1 Tax=Triticum aestivum TaxID=4565 RepID=UPI001D02F6B9|nr:uncharacterized protein LOC123115570 [Triticum aestivum]
MREAPPLRGYILAAAEARDRRGEGPARRASERGGSSETPLLNLGASYVRRGGRLRLRRGGPMRSGAFALAKMASLSGVWIGEGEVREEIHGALFSRPRGMMWSELLPLAHPVISQALFYIIVALRNNDPCAEVMIPGGWIVKRFLA